jgi:arginase
VSSTRTSLGDEEAERGEVVPVAAVVVARVEGAQVIRRRAAGEHEPEASRLPAAGRSRPDGEAGKRRGAIVAAMPDRDVAIIGAELDLGAGRRGVDMGPSAIRYAGLGERIEAIGLGATDLGNVPAAVAETVQTGDESARFLGEIKATCERVAERVAEASERGLLPLVLGGDHSIALGTVGGMASRAGAGAALWLDAHGDLNTPETTPSGNVHGMPLAAALGQAEDGFRSPAWPLPALDPARVSLVGVRSLDDGERRIVRDLGLAVFTMSEIDRRGVQHVVREALERARGARFVHVSLDMDVIDPDVAPGVGTPVRGGLSYREAHLAMELVAESGLLDSFEIVEVNPILDRVNETAELAVELAASALGARIL